MAKARELASALDTPEKALAAGFAPATDCVPGMGGHWLNFARFDTTLDPEMPEVVLFEPASADLTDWTGARFLGIEYVVVTEGTEANTTATVPQLHEVPLVGPMPGHFPGMPWHAELHVYLAEGSESNETFPEVAQGVNCPAGTLPNEVQIRGTAEAIAADLGTPEDALAAGFVPAAVCAPGQGVHWVNMERFDTTLETEMPEALLFLPDGGNVFDHANATLVGVEWVVVTQGTESNTTETVPRLIGHELDGPMPGHFPGMPWHAELHVWIGDYGRTDPFTGDNDLIVCPEGTTLPPTAAADLRAVTPQGVGSTSGRASFAEGPFQGSLAITINVTGLTPGEHGVHVHENGNCDATTPPGSGPIGAGGAGGHFNPDASAHGQHAGDLGNILVGEDGTGSLTANVPLTLAEGAHYGVTGRSVIVHADRDDGTTQPSGNSGLRVLCGIIAAAA